MWFRRKGGDMMVANMIALALGVVLLFLLVAVCRASEYDEEDEEDDDLFN
jgi:hypothetical protein